MDNPYWASYGQVHHIDLEDIKSLCFELSNIYYASKTISEELTTSEQIEETMVKMDDFPLAKLHLEMAFRKSSEIILRLALLVRTFDDQMKGSEFEKEYIKFTQDNDSSDYIGYLSTKNKFNIRQACNKIIHAHEIRPLYEKSDLVISGSNGENIWYLTSEIELSGTERGKEWDAVLYLNHFLESVLGLIEFKPPTASN